MVETCVPYDPESKGGSEATVRVAKADLVPTTANLLDDYRDFAELAVACAGFEAMVNARPHAETRRPPAKRPCPSIWPFASLPGRPAWLTRKRRSGEDPRAAGIA